MNSRQSFKLPNLAHAPVLGLPVNICDYPQAAVAMRAGANNSTTSYLVAAANTHIASLAHREKPFEEAMKKFDLILPDGMPLVWYLNRIHRAKLRDRVYGPDLMRHILATTGPNERHFLLGGSNVERQKLEQVVARDYPQAKIAGSYSPPFGPWPADEEERIIRLLRESEPTFVWVGLGCPKQELLLARMKDALPPAAYVAVGAAFSLIGGTVKQAPLSWQRLGLEWAFRLLTEPRRLWRRYLVNNTYFVILTGWELIRKATGNRKSCFRFTE
jgi:N-acetylglucosaminyldiphosphoundecaprenol N-acetyl-beta-D-mannosaminyltransferase